MNNLIVLLCSTSIVFTQFHMGMIMFKDLCSKYDSLGAGTETTLGPETKWIYIHHSPGSSFFLLVQLKPRCTIVVHTGEVFSLCVCLREWMGCVWVCVCEWLIRCPLLSNLLVALLNQVFLPGLFMVEGTDLGMTIQPPILYFLTQD